MTPTEVAFDSLMDAIDRYAHGIGPRKANLDYVKERIKTLCSSVARDAAKDAAFAMERIHAARSSPPS